MAASVFSMAARQGVQVRGCAPVAFTLQQLHVFLAVVDHETFSEAADALGLRQSTVSFHIRSLEESTGVRLFQVSQRRRELTPAGEAMVLYARTLIVTASQAERAMQDFRFQRKRKLVIGTSRVPGTYIVPRVIQRYHQKRPDIDIFVEAVPTQIVRRRLEDREIDVGFVMDAGPVASPLTGITVLSDEIGCVFSPNTGLQWLKPPITANQLKAVPLIGHAPESSTAQVCDDWAKQQNVDLTPFMTIGSIDIMKTCVSLGMGTALLSKMMVYREVEAGNLLYTSLAQAPTRELHLIYRHESDHALLSDFVQTVVEVVEMENGADERPNY